jgi:hypothetical protein
LRQDGDQISGNDLWTKRFFVERRAAKDLNALISGCGVCSSNPQLYTPYEYSSVGFALQQTELLTQKRREKKKFFGKKI